jgi:hypothetical protein
MTYQNCPRCQLAIRVRADHLAPRNCPRCIARQQVAVPMYESIHPARLAASVLLGDQRSGTPAVAE